MRLQVKVTASSLAIRKTASTQLAPVGYLKKDDLVTVIKEQGGFYYLSDARGWIGKNYTKLVKNLETTSSTTKTTQTATAPKTKSAQTGVKSVGLDKKLTNMLYVEAKNKPGNISASTRMFGAPHQFSPLTDFRIGTEEYGLGRKFIEANITEAPIVYFLPGRPNYLPTTNTGETEAMTNALLGANDGDNKTVIDRILGTDDFRYFSFLTDYAKYMRYVNMLCRAASIYMGLGDRTAPKSTKQYKHYDWSNYRFDTAYKQKTTPDSLFDFKNLVNSAHDAMFGEYQYVQFYVDPSTSFSESSSNNTSQSKLAGMFDSAQGIVKELAFLMDAAAISKQSSALQSFSSGVEDLKNQLGGSDGFFKRLLGSTSNILSGANLMFPEIWGDAAYNKSYNVTINLVSPYGDKESIYLNVIVPLMHILAMTLPRQVSANSYSAPFLVKVFAKGWFSCQMGIIDSISIDKGGNGAWTIDGLPSEVRVQLGIKDLYGNMAITPSSEPGLFFQNPGLIEFLAVTCGMDISKPELGTKLDAMMSLLANSIVDIPTDIARDLLQRLRNSIEPYYKI